jgi:hypothetical protein
MLFSRDFSTRLDEYKASSIGSHDSDGQYRLYGTDQFTCHPEVYRGAGHYPAGLSA